MKSIKAVPISTLLLSVLAVNAIAEDNAAQRVDNINVEGVSLQEPKGVMPALDGGKIFEGKKTSVVELSEQPVLVEPNLRQMFARLPGVMVSEQQVPSFYNVNYRGLGDPHESEFIAFFQNGVPLAANMFGYPTMYYMPGAQRIERIEFVRGGAGLLYGPQIGPVMNFVTRGPDARADSALRTEHATGSDGLYSTYNEVSWAQGDTGFMASYDHRSADGPRHNEDYRVDAGYFGLSYEGFDNIKLGANLDVYRSDSGEAGRLTSAEFAKQRDLVKTPFNRVEIDQVIASLTFEQRIDEHASLNAQLWYNNLDRLSRRSAAFVAPAPEPTKADIDEQQFSNLGADVRYSLIWNSDNILTFGVTAYDGDSPRTRHVSSDIRATRQKAEELRFEQDRATRYSALFVENLFQLGQLSLSPTVRVERMNYDLTEQVKLQSLQRAPIDLNRTFTETLLGLGGSYELAEQSQFYANISESYRPQRFDDLINPTSELAGTNGPSASRAMNYELGYRGDLTEALSLDVSVFRIDFTDKIEQRQVNVADIERVNSGDSRHEGIELSLEYDLLSSPSHALTWFANGSLLDAQMTRSISSNLLGKDPAFSPDHVIRTGLLFNNDRLNMALTATIVDDHYWQDSNLPRGTGAATIAAKVPAYEVLDLTGEYRLAANWELYSGINNLLNERYYSRVRSDGIEPGTERTLYLGVRFSL